MPLPTSPLSYPSAGTIAGWAIKSRGVRDGSHPTEVYKVGAATWEGKWFVKWADRHAFIEWMVGKSMLWNDTGTTKLSRLMPFRAPDPAGTKLIVTQCTGVRGHKFVENNTSNVPTPKYEQAECTFLLELATFNLVEDALASSEIDRFVSHPDSTEPAGEFLQLPSTANLYYHAIPGSPQAGSSIDNTPITANQYGKVQVQETFTASWHMLPEDAYEPDSNVWNRIYGTAEDDPTGVPYKGCINSAEFLGRPIGTVLFTKVRPKREANATATGFWWTLEYEFCYKPNGWNWLYGWAGGTAKSGWYWVGPKDSPIHYANTVADDESLYNARDLTKLFSVAAA